MRFATRSEKLAWAAGFFEGEGCFFANRSKIRRDGTRRMRSEASLPQVDKSLLYVFQEIVGFGAVYLSKEASETQQECWVWKTTRNGETEKLLRLIGHMLSERRLSKARADIAEQADQIDMRSVSWNKGTTKGRMADCHPDRKHCARGFCRPCWSADYYERSK